MPSSSLKITGLSKRYGDVVALAPIDARGWFAIMWLMKYGVLRVSAHG